MRTKTINQLLDAISEIKLDDMTEELGKKRQQLIDAKNQIPNGGLTPIQSTPEIMEMINRAKENQSK